MPRIAVLSFVLLFCANAFAQPASETLAIEEIRSTTNWRFVTKDWLKTIRERQRDLVGTPVTVVGVVRDSDNRAVLDALVLLRVPSNRSDANLKDGVVEDVFAMTWTDQSGVFKFKGVNTPWREPVRANPYSMCVFAPGHATYVENFDARNQRPNIIQVKLTSGQTIHGTVVDRDGKPIPDATAILRGIKTADHSKGYSPIGSEELSLLRSELKTRIPVSDDGHFEIGGLPENRIAVVSVSVEGRSPTGLRRTYCIATSNDIDRSKLIDKNHRFANHVYPLLDPSFEIRSQLGIDEMGVVIDKKLTPPATAPEKREATIRIVDKVTGKGVSAVGISVLTQKIGERLEMYRQPQHVSNRDGFVRLQIPSTKCAIVCFGRRFGYLTHYERISTGATEYAPKVPGDYWIRQLAKGNDAVKVNFQLTPVAPLEIQVQTKDGNPIPATVSVQSTDWECFFELMKTDAKGGVAIHVRPVLFDLQITATTENGLSGTITQTLFQDLDKDDSATIIVDKAKD